MTDVQFKEYEGGWIALADDQAGDGDVNDKGGADSVWRANGRNNDARQAAIEGRYIPDRFLHPTGTVR